MIKRLIQISLLGACASALAACNLEKPEAKPAPNYQAPTPTVAEPANIRTICFNETEISAFRVRMAQQELAVGVLQCKGSDGSRLYDKQYNEFIAKFNPELSGNAKDLQSIVARKRKNFDVVVTEIANRTGGRPADDPAFCSRHLRALEWALTPGVSSLTQVPSPYDFGPEMSVFVCPM